MLKNYEYHDLCAHSADDNFSKGPKPGIDRLIDVAVFRYNLEFVLLILLTIHFIINSLFFLSVSHQVPSIVKNNESSSSKLDSLTCGSVDCYLYNMCNPEGYLGIAH